MARNLMVQGLTFSGCQGKKGDMRVLEWWIIEVLEWWSNGVVE